MKTNIKFSRGLAFSCGFLLMLCSGLVFSWSIFAGPIEVELGFTRQQTSLVFPFSLSVSIFGQMLAGYLQKKIGLRYNFFIAAGLYLSGFWIASQSHTIEQIYLGYGVLVGLAIGMLFNAVLINVPGFSFPKKESLGTGMVLVGFGMGSMVLGTLAAQLIQTSGWRAVFTGFAIGYAVLSVLGSVLIPSSIHLKNESGKKEETKNMSPSQLLRLRSYRTFFLWSVVLVWGALVVSGHAALCAAELTPDSMVASNAVTANAVANIFSRVIFGYSYQRFGERRCRWSLTTLACIGALVCVVSYIGRSLLGLFLGFAVLGAVNGGNSVVGTAYIRERFGMAYFGPNTAMTNMHLAISSFIGPGVAGVMRTQSGSYTSVFLVMVLISAAAAILLYTSITYEKKELSDLKLKEIRQLG